MASSSSSSKRPLRQKLYDAFINHRGPDVKETVAFVLYELLEENECCAFLDDREIELGDSIDSVIQNAIYSSTVQIAIFSPRYAESSWCLDELVHMLKTGALFIPVFCDVKPSDVRYPDKGNGVYAPAFAEHEQKGRFSKERLQQWKEALYSSGGFSGHELRISEDTSEDDVVALCTKIASAVQQEVGKTFNGFPGYVEAAKRQKGLHADAAASTSTSEVGKKSSLLPRDSHPVGIDYKVKEMEGLLENPKVQVIAVVGMGGSGKTILLQNVNKAVKSKYDHSIWLSISKSYSVKNLQHDIATHVGLNIAAVTEGRAAELIHGRLEGTKCIIILDDLWTLSTEDNLIDKLGLPSDKHCKVLVSTRNKQVALNSRAHIYEMKNLSDEESWRLFCAYAFADNEGNKEPQQHLEEIGREIVKQSGNLPLAIKTIGASLANTTIAADWELKLRQLKGVVRVNVDSDPIMPVLRLSYDSLPAGLQPCFAYLSFFPEDEEIDCEYLINLWIGEGLIPSGEGQQEVAWSCLYQLANLCLLQLLEEREGSFYDLAKKCKVHDLLYDLAIDISRENKCAVSVEEASSGTGWCRVLLAKKDINDNAISEIRPVCLRTLSLYLDRNITSIPANFFTAMRGLRVLDLSWTHISTLPASVGKMRLLRVLNLRQTQMEEVPECVRHLKSLLFLVISGNCKELPVWISELICLQYLECWGVDRMPKGISNLASLRTLRSNSLKLSIEEDEFMRLDDLVNMTQLQELWLEVEHEMELKKMEEGILAHLVNMRCLHIQNIGEGAELPQFPENMRAMKHLESLILERIAVPSWICELANLRELELIRCDCSDYPELQRMPNLVRLVLDGNERCRELPKVFGKSGGFPHLLLLFIFDFCELEEFPELEEGAMATLEELYLKKCSKVKKVEGLERLKRLKLFDYWTSVGTNEWRETLKEGGEYWNKIKAINPHITIIDGFCS